MAKSRLLFKPANSGLHLLVSQCLPASGAKHPIVSNHHQAHKCHKFKDFKTSQMLSGSHASLPRPRFSCQSEVTSACGSAGPDKLVKVTSSKHRGWKVGSWRAPVETWSCSMRDTPWGYTIGGVEIQIAWNRSDPVWPVCCGFTVPFC